MPGGDDTSGWERAARDIAEHHAVDVDGATRILDGAVRGEVNDLRLLLALVASVDAAIAAVWQDTDAP